MSDDSEVPPLEECSDKNEDEDSDGWDEMEVSAEQTTCLFCTYQFLTIAVALDHCRTEHNFDLLELKNKYNMDCYSYIKMINYIRKLKPNPKEIIDSPTPVWDDDAYLKPGEMESWLMYDFDDLGSAPSTPHYAIDGKTPISNINYSDLKRQIQDLTVQLRNKELILQNAMKDISKMREVTKTIIESGDAKHTIPTNVSALPPGCDSSYFNSYAHFGIHYEMLSDTIRTESYKSAILNNTELFKDKVVLDLGCGTGILSMFAARAGASKVIAIDQSEVVYKAMEIIRENKLEDKIDVIKGRIEDTKLPVDKVDIIVSEWMGYFLLFEAMLDSFIYARDKYLTEGGMVLPNKCSIHLVGCSDSDRYNKLVNYWDDVYGFSMKCMKKEVLKEAMVDIVPKDKILTNAVDLTHIDLMTCNMNTCEFSCDFTLEAKTNGTLTSLAGYFDINFDLPNQVYFTTGPHGEKTHWQQTVFYLKKTVDMKAGDKIKGSIMCSRLKNYLRGLAITLVLAEEKYEYILE